MIELRTEYMPCDLIVSVMRLHFETLCLQLFCIYVPNNPVTSACGTIVSNPAASGFLGVLSNTAIFILVSQKCLLSQGY